MLTPWWCFMDNASLSGFHHVVLTVGDLERSVRWYCEVLDFSPLFPWNTDDFRRQLLMHPGGAIIGLTEHSAAAAGAAFDETRPGLDHLAFGVRTREQLDAWVERFDAAGVVHSGVQVTPETGFTLVAFRDPDSIQLELYLAQTDLR